VRESQAEVRAGDLEGALESARSAASVEPYAATPKLQEALVLELLGDLDAAAAAGREATEAEATNWRTWQVLSRLEAKRGDVGASIAAYRRARALNPRSPLFVR
jgi:Flp pilus assembly protein TadD